VVYSSDENDAVESAGPDALPSPRPARPDGGRPVGQVRVETARSQHPGFRSRARDPAAGMMAPWRVGSGS
jgi:hypothetical protein